MTDANIVADTVARKSQILRRNPKRGGFIAFLRKPTCEEIKELENTYLSSIYVCFFSFVAFVAGGVISPRFLGFLAGAYKGVTFLRGNLPWVPAAENQVVHAPMLREKTGPVFGHKIQRSGPFYMGEIAGRMGLCVLGCVLAENMTKVNTLITKEIRK